MTQNDWPERFVRIIAGEVRRYRKRAGMSAQQLADECEKRSLPMKRSVLANLESGRRTTISVPELLVLADVLGVPAMLLLFPWGYAETVEALPGRDPVRPEDAIRWFEGRTGSGALPDVGADSAVALYPEHASALSLWERMNGLADQALAEAGAAEAAGRGDAPELRASASKMQDQREAAASVVWLARRKMRDAGMTVLPPLPAGLEHIEGARRPG